VIAIMSVTQRQVEDEDVFWRKLVLPEEDHLRMGKPWTGGYRWFRSPNVVPIEQARKKRGSSGEQSE
jgi:hypothetical protein